VALLYISLILSQLSHKEYIDLRRAYIESSNCSKLAEISYQKFKDDKKNLMYISDLLLSLACLNREGDFRSFSDSLFKYFKNPSAIYSVIKVFERYEFSDEVIYLVEKSRSFFKHRRLFEREYLRALVRRGRFFDFWNEFLRLRNRLGYLDLFSDFIRRVDRKELIRFYEETRKKGFRELYPSFLREFLDRKIYDYAFEIFDLLNHRKKRDSLLVFLYEDDPESFFNIVSKKLNNCEKVQIFIKTKNYKRAFHFSKNCNNEKLKILSSIFYFIENNEIEKADSVLSNNLKLLKENKEELGKIYYHLAKYRKADSLLKGFENFENLFLRAKANIFSEKLGRADSIISKTILRFPDDENIYKALFIYYLLKFEDKENVKKILKLNEKIEKGLNIDLSEYDLKDKWKHFFDLKIKVSKGEFFEVNDTLLDKNLLASLYFEGYKNCIKKGKKEEARKFLEYIIKNFKDTPYFIIAQRKLAEK